MKHKRTVAKGEFGCPSLSCAPKLLRPETGALLTFHGFDVLTKGVKAPNNLEQQLNKNHLVTL